VYYFWKRDRHVWFMIALFGVAALGRGGRIATWLAPTAFMFTSEPDLRATSLPGRRAARVVAPVGVVVPDATPAPPPTDRDEREAIVCVHDASSRSRAATAIRTVAMLAPRHPRLQLVITGEGGGYDDDLRMQASALNVLHRVSFLGERADELQVMREAQLGWVVADADTAAYGILDLMALGIPVLAGEGTVAEHYVLSNITGILLPAGDAYFTAACVAEFLSNAHRRAMMGHAAQHRIARDFPEEHMIDGFERAAVAAMARR
jgi:glycosyltransferase involved in cell wall biosynthesis